jgi:hypothetical protein
MATVRDGGKSALVVVDVQVGVMREAWDAPRVIGNVAMRWLSYPGRRSRSVSVDELDFTTA